MRGLFSNKKNSYCSGGVFLGNMGWRGIISGRPVILLDFGGSSQHQGIAMAMCTIGIAPCMFLYPRLLRRFGIVRMIQAGYLLTDLRILRIGLVRSLWMMVFIQLFESISFGIFQHTVSASGRGSV